MLCVVTPPASLFLIIAYEHLPEVSLLHPCLGPWHVPPALLRPLTRSMLCRHSCSPSWSLAPFSIGFPLVSLVTIVFYSLFVFFPCADSQVFLLVTCLCLRCSAELAVQPVCLWVNVQRLPLLGWGLTAVSGRRGARQCPKEGCCFPLPVMGRFSWASRPPKTTPVLARERWQQRAVGRGHPVALLGVVSHPCPFGPRCAVTSARRCSPGKLWHQGDASSLMPLAPAGTGGWRWVEKELVFAAGEVQQRSCLSRGPCAGLLWLRRLLRVRAELTQAKGDRQKRVVFLIRNPTGMKSAETWNSLMKTVYISSLEVGILACFLFLKHTLTFLLLLIAAILFSICSSHQHLIIIG